MSKKNHLEQHKIAILISLLVDYAEQYPDVTVICEEVIDDLYQNIDEIKKTNYFQTVSKLIEERITTDLLMIGLLTILSLCEIRADSQKALKLTKELETMCNSLPQKYNVNDLNVCNEKVNTIIRKNFKNIQKKAV